MFKLMIIGCGVRGNMWNNCISDDPNCEVTAYMDINYEATERLQQAVGNTKASLFTNFDEALENADVDGVILCTPPHYHFDQASAIMNKGFHLMAEKPLTEDFDSSLELVKLAERTKRILIVGMQFRYMPVTQAYKKLIDEGAFGSPNFAQFSYIRTRNPQSYKGMILNQYCNDMAHTFLLEQAIHHLDLIRFVYSADFETIQAFEWNPTEWAQNPYKQDPNVSALCTLTNGMHINYMGTWISGNEGMNEGIDFRWRTDCENGFIVQPTLFGQSERLYVANRMDAERTTLPIEPVVPFVTDTKKLLTEFYECWKDKKAPETSGKDHLKTLATVLACIESAVTGTKVSIKEFQKSLNFPSEWL